MPVKQMALKRADRCRECGAELPVGTRAEWNSDLRVVTCVPCVEARPPAPMAPSDEMAAPAPPPGSVSSESVDSVVEEGPAPIDVGVPGASARQEHQRRQAKRERRIEEKWGTGRLGRIAKALSDDPQSTRAWKEGAIGEERVAQVLTERLGDTAVLLHDRKVPGTRGNIDHIAVASSGVTPSARAWTIVMRPRLHSSS